MGSPIVARMRPERAHAHTRTGRRIKRGDQSSARWARTRRVHAPFRPLHARTCAASMAAHWRRRRMRERQGAYCAPRPPPGAGRRRTPPRRPAGRPLASFHCRRSAAQRGRRHRCAFPPNGESDAPSPLQRPSLGGRSAHPPKPWAAAETTGPGRPWLTRRRRRRPRPRHPRRRRRRRLRRSPPPRRRPRPAR